MRIGEEAWDLVLNLGLAFVIYASLGYALSTDVPLTAVVSDSMEPNLYKGDMLLVYGTQDVAVGDIIVYQNPKTNLPIVHRVIEDQDGDFITKGDNNAADDITLGITDNPVSIEQVHGKSIFKLPYLGWVKIMFLRGIGYNL